MSSELYKLQRCFYAVAVLYIIFIVTNGRPLAITVKIKGMPIIYQYSHNGRMIVSTPGHLGSSGTGRGHLFYKTVLSAAMYMNESF